MKSNIKLISENPDLNNVKKTVLTNRGIRNVEEYITLGTRNLHDFMLLGEEILKNAYDLLQWAIKNESPIFILVDTDTDGYCSAAILYSYITKNIGYKNVEYILNQGKIHGLTQKVVEYLYEKPMGLLFIPDAGSNDVEFCKNISEKHNIVILDHHDQDVENPYAVVINPKTSDYPNKNLCGAAVVYKFLQYVDDEYFEVWANQYLDLIAVAMVADVMDLRNLESRFLVTRGLMNIENKFLKAIIEKNAFYISNTNCPNAIDVAFYISPAINACIRIGTTEDCEILFRAFVEDDRGETFKYKPRKSKNNLEPKEIDEEYYTHVTRNCLNLKGKQDRVCEKEMERIVEHIGNDNSKIVVLNESDFVPELMGVLANKITNQIKKPVILLRDISDQEHPNLFSGSGRNYKNSYVYNLKEDVSHSGLVEKAAGHSSAFGIEIIGKNVSRLKDYFNDLYENVDTTKTYYVDYWLNGGIPFSLIQNINEMKALFSNFVEEPYIACDNIDITMEDIEIKISSSGNKWFSFTKDSIEYVKFKLSENDKVLELVENLFDTDSLVFDVVGKTKVNIFGGKITPQFIIDDYDVKVI